MLKFLCTVVFFMVTVKANDDKTIPYAFFGSRTSYKTVLPPPNIEIPEHHTARQIIMLARHATRTPSRTFSTKKLPKLIELKSKITKSPTLSERDFQAIKNWATTIDITGHRSLTPKGRDEMKGLAIRVREAFPNLFERQYDPDVYKVLSTKSERCVISGKVFMENVLNDEAIPELPICDNTDILLTLEGMMKDDEEYDDVQAYIKDQEKEFKGGPHMAGVVQRVAAKLGIDSEELNPEIITTMYEASAYEYSNDESVVPAWYNVFCPDDLEILEYGWDLTWYYVVGYGNPYNKKLACPVAIRLEKYLKNKINGEGPNGVFYFASEKNILILLFILGLGDGDISYTASSYKGTQDLNWRTSLYCPWTANFMAVLYQDDQEEYYVSFYFNEKLTSITLRNGSPCTICPWLGIQDKLTAFIIENDCFDFVATKIKKNNDKQCVKIS